MLKTNRIYFPQKTHAHPTRLRQPNRGGSTKNCSILYNQIVKRVESPETGLRFPRSVQFFPIRPTDTTHPSEKPVALFEYLIRTYTLPSEIVLAPFAGSGTTGIACLNTGRKYINIEKHAPYFRMAKHRLHYAKEKIQNA